MDASAHSADGYNGKPSDLNAAMISPILECTTNFAGSTDVEDRKEALAARWPGTRFGRSALVPSRHERRLPMERRGSPLHKNRQRRRTQVATLIQLNMKRVSA